MLVYGVCIGNESKYRSIAKPSLDRLGLEVLKRRGQQSIFEAYNSILGEVRGRTDVSGLVLMHEDVELVDGDPEALVEALAEPDVAVVGAVGSRRPPSLAWWNAAEKFGHVVESRTTIDWSSGLHDVHVVDGLLLALSPWAIAHLRFDEKTFTGFHAYADDICFQALSHGRRVVVTDLGLVHHSKGGYGDYVRYLRSDLAWRRKWQDHPAYGGTKADLRPGIWHLKYATTPLRVRIG